VAQSDAPCACWQEHKSNGALNASSSMPLNASSWNNSMLASPGVNATASKEIEYIYKVVEVVVERKVEVLVEHVIDKVHIPISYAPNRFRAKRGKLNGIKRGQTSTSLTTEYGICCAFRSDHPNMHPPPKKKTGALHRGAD